MKTYWDSSSICSGFEAYRDIPEQLLGYRWLLHELRPYQGEGKTVLDYGCGPGKVAMRVAESGVANIVAVDASPSMIEIARSRRSHSAITYRLIESGKLPFLNDSTISAAFACFVFINIGSNDEIEMIVREVYRVLRHGEPFLIIDTNPRATGIEFSTFRNGENRWYEIGEQKIEVLRVPGGDLVLHDYYWPPEMYQDLLGRVGFRAIEYWEPTLRDIPRRELENFSILHEPINWKGEWSHAPFILFRAQK